MGQVLGLAEAALDLVDLLGGEHPCQESVNWP
jgi:hypothetical protein